MYPFETWLSQAQDQLDKTGHPLVSLCYAQSLDGSLSDQPGKPYKLSGPQSSELTHQLRSLHTAILVGVGTVLADDPLLTARLPGRKTSLPQPRPVVLDSALRTSPAARLIQGAEKSPWIIATSAAQEDRRSALLAAGVEIFELPADAQGKVSLPDLLVCLGQRGISSLMVEGGARILQAFLAQQLADQAIITLAPMFLGGVPVIEPWGRNIQEPFRMIEVGSQQLGEDVVIWGKLKAPA
jgi:3,4-dihydroxy 2-butanone 4-phosphate synthase/GTP cyclohydrolase II